ncbi:MAG: biopolymer transporter ExbD [bacterium]|nr:biopolymer transporter ExbD [bacterium]
MKLKQRATISPDIPTASMADIAFLLLIFFLVTTGFFTEKGLQIVLPEKGEEVKIKSTNIANVFVNAAGQVKIGEDEVPLPDIKEKAKHMLTENDSLVFSLTVDRKCKYDKVIKVFDELRLADAERIAFAPPRVEKE